jgi:hypothetical protein
LAKGELVFQVEIETATELWAGLTVKSRGVIVVLLLVNVPLVPVGAAVTVIPLAT